MVAPYTKSIQGKWIVPLEQNVVLVCAMLNIFLIIAAFRKQMLFVFFMATFAFIYFMLRPVLVYCDFYIRYRALYPEFLLIPASYWAIAAALAIVNVGFLFWLYLRFGKKEQLIWASWRRLPERNHDRLAFFITGPSALLVLGEGAYYFCLAYLLVYKARMTTKIFATAIIIIFIVTTEDRRHFVGILIFIMVAWIQANRESLTKMSVSSLLRQVVYLSLGLLGMISIAALSIYYRSPENLSSIMNWRNAAAIVEIQLDFAHIYDELHNLASELIFGDRDFVWFGLMFARILFFYIPRSLWTEKPETISREYAEAFNPVFYENSGALPVGLIGDAIFSFGFFFFIGLILAIELFRLYVRLKGNSHFGLTMLTIVTFFLIRGPFDSALFILAVGILFYAARYLFEQRQEYHRNPYPFSSIS